MEPAYHHEKIFDKINFQEYPLSKGEYEECVFKNCDLSNSDLSEIKFIECEFSSCNLSLAKLTNTGVRDLKFKDSKILGLHFNNCSKFGMSFSFENCTLNHSSFYQTKIKNTSFKNCQLQDIDFTECDLSSSVFHKCDFLNSTFDRTILEKADLRTSINYSIDPEKNRVKKAKFSLTEVAGLLDKYEIDIDNAG